MADSCRAARGCEGIEPLKSKSLLRKSCTSGQAIYPPRKDSTSVTVSYALKVGPSTYLVPALSYTDHPSFAAVLGEGSDLNISMDFNVYL
jgi:hypothetical protein